MKNVFKKYIRKETIVKTFFFLLFPVFLSRYPNTTDTAAAINSLGCKHMSTGVGESHVDEKNKLVSTSAFMCDAPIHEIFDGIGSMVRAVLKLA